MGTSARWRGGEQAVLEDNAGTGGTFTISVLTTLSG
jgi:hypothetical protein